MLCGIRMMVADRRAMLEQAVLHTNTKGVLLSLA